MRFASCLEGIKSFLREKGTNHHKSEKYSWPKKFYFMVDVTQQVSELNVKLQGKGNVAYTMLEEVECFENKLQGLIESIERGNSVFFKHLNKYR